MPGIGVRTGARLLIEVGDGSASPTVDRLAAYAGLAPATRNSGSSLRGEQPSCRGNKRLERAFFLFAFAGPPLCLAGRRADVLFAMPRDGTFPESRPTAVA